MLNKLVYKFSEKIKCPAKINFGLVIPFRYPNGYHHIVSALIPINLYDEISIEVSINEPGSPSIAPSYNKESTLEPTECFSLTWQNNLPVNLTSQSNHNPIFEEEFEKNIMTKAYRWFKQSSFLLNSKETNLKEFQNVRSILQAPWDTKFHVVKSIPSPAGLGGGSSDAAGVLKSCLAILQTLLSNTEFNAYKMLVMKNCITLGADIPFFMQEQPAIISGIGEIFSPITLPLPLLGICCVPDFGFSTKEMYESLNRPVKTKINTATNDIGKPNINATAEDAKSAPKGIPKKTLQGDDLMLHSLTYGPKLIRDIISGVSKDYTEFSDHISSKNTLVKNASERVFTIENEFVEVSREMFPHKSKYIDLIQKKITELVNLELAKRKIAKPAFSSMSGSGSAIYTAMFLNKDATVEMKQGLKNILKSLRNLYPDCYWTMICSK